MMRPNADPDDRERRLFALNSAAAVLILLALAAGLIYALGVTSSSSLPAEKPLDWTRATPPSSRPGSSLSALPRRFEGPVPNAIPAAPMPLPPHLPPTPPGREAYFRKVWVTPLRDLVQTVRDSDTERFWQGTPVSERRLLSATDALSTHTTLVTAPDRFPEPLAPYARAAAAEMRGYLKTTENARDVPGDDLPRYREAAHRYLVRSERAIDELETAVHRYAASPADEEGFDAVPAEQAGRGRNTFP